MFKFSAIPALLLFLNLPLSAQEALEIQHSCNFAAADTFAEVYTYDASAEAKQIVEQVMNTNVLPQNFVIKAADCNNALATTIGKQRFILYNTTFLENFKKDANTRWAAFCVLAHEIGHHLSNHDLEENNPAVRKRFELEADRFAGGILFRLGATLEEAQAGINTFSLKDASLTHPPKRARLEALAVGWKQAEELAANAGNTEGSVAEDSDEKKLYRQALDEKDPYKAIELLDQAIEIREDYADAYLERGKRKVDVEDVDEMRVNFGDAIADFDVYIQMRPKNPAAYSERGYAHRRVDHDSLALADYNRAIRLDAKFHEAYLGRAWVKMKTDDHEAALKDLEKATNVKPDYAEAWYWHGNIQYNFGEYDLVIADMDKALQANPVYIDALDLRAGAKMFSNRFADAIEDFDRLQKLDPEFNSHFDRGKCYQSLGKHREAIADFDASLQRHPDFSDAFMHRGLSKMILGQKEEADKDFEKTFTNTVLTTNYSIKIGCLLVEFGHAKEGLVWLDAVLAKYPDNQQALTCKTQALKK
ncbi:MAG: tetratricopeptide repeat protein [Lewinellaceae bacterium]|nr:tetratricopeptide repeat protein [Lewinellaceae bacterium]